MENNVVLTSESVIDLSPALMERYGIKIIPLNISLGGKVYSDGIDINPEMIYEHNKKTGELPKTTAANISEYTDFFKKFTDEGKTVIHFSLSGEFSSTCNNAKIAAEDLGNVFVVDTRNLSTGAGLVVLYAADLVKSGMAPEEVAQKCNEITPCVDASFIIDSLEYLHKGGRCSAVAMFGANLLKIKPCIEVKNGAMGVGKKYRGKFDMTIKEYVKDRLHDLDDIDTTRVFVTHAGCDEELMNEMVKYVSDLNIFKEIFLTRAGCTISSHCGKDCMGVLFIRKSPI